MTNPYFTESGNPHTLDRGASAIIRDEFINVRKGFDALPDLSVLADANAYTIDTGTVNAIVCTLSSGAVAYIDGMEITVRAKFSNTGAVTIMPGTLAAKSVVRSDGTPMQAGDYLANHIIKVVYNIVLDAFEFSNNAINAAASAYASAVIATTQAGIATTQASNASVSYLSFDKRYLGAKNTDPTLDNQGGSLLVGALYFNAITFFMYAWSGTAWVTFKGDDGRGIYSIVRTSGSGAAGSTDTYTITYTDSTTSTFTVVNGSNGTNGTNGRGIVSVSRTSGTGAAGSTDTYTIAYTDATTSTFTVVNGANGTNGTDGVGVPTGGTTGQALVKNSNTNFDTKWADQTGSVTNVSGAYPITSTGGATPEVGITDGAVLKSSGFPTDTNGNFLVTLAYNETTRTVTITPTGATFSFFVAGVKYTKTGAQSIVHGTTQGTNYIYYDNTGTLVVGTTFWNLHQTAPVAIVYWDTTNSRGLCSYETHHAGRDVFAHITEHTSEGSYLVSGCVVDTASYSIGTLTDAGATFAIGTGVIADEDLWTNIQALPDAGPYTILHKIGAAGDFRISYTNTVPFLRSGTNTQYNQFTAGAWQLTSLANNRFVNYYVFAAPVLPTTAITPTPTATRQIIIVPGQAVYTSLALAQAETVSSIDWGTYPFAEIVPLYQVTYRYLGAGGGTTDMQGIVKLIGTKTTLSVASQPATNAANVVYAPTGNIAATNVQDAIDELDTEKQPLGNELTALQSLADTAGFLKKTGNGAYSIDAATYQPLDGDLTAIAALTTTGIIRRTATDTFAAGGDQALGNSNLSGIKNATFNGQGASNTTTGAVTIDWSAAQNYLQAEPTGSITYTFTAPAGVCHLQLLIASDGTSTAQAITWPASVKWLGATWAAAANKGACINFWYDGTSYWAMGSNQV